jgi:hypothetical protein
MTLPGSPQGNSCPDQRPPSLLPRTSKPINGSPERPLPHRQALRKSSGAYWLLVLWNDSDHYGIWLGVGGHVTATLGNNVFQHVTTPVFTSP